MSRSVDKPFIVFTDLDATLLDHTTYSYTPAQPMIDFLMAQDIPLVFVTSKTEPEVKLLQERIGICAPFIVENGGAIFIPRCCELFYKGPEDAEYEIITLGKTYDHCIRIIDRLQKDFPLRGFSQMSQEEVSQLTGLDALDATMAKDRHCSEPFLLEDPSSLEAIQVVVALDGFTVTKGGRFYHLISDEQDKGIAVHRLLDHMHKRTGVTFHSIALGDSENDFSMLASVDIPILIPKADGSYATLELTNLIKAPFSGPKGWNSVLEELLHEK